MLGGKIRYRQFDHGHRSGFEPVLLAASIPARPGDRVLEAGCGAGAALLCLGHRLERLSGVGVEIEPDLAALANENFKINNLGGFSCQCAAVEQVDVAGRFEHIMANPPWHGRASTQPADRLKALAHHAGPALLAKWVERFAACLAPRGSLTFILPASALTEATAAFRAHRLGGVTLFPFWPRAGRPAKLIILAATLNGRGPDRILPGLILHDETGITEAAQAILRDGEAIDLAG